MRCPQVHYRKLPEKLFLKLETGEADVMTCYDPDGDIALGDSFCIYLFDTKTEHTVRKIYRRVTEIPVRRSRGYVDVTVGEAE